MTGRRGRYVTACLAVAVLVTGCVATRIRAEDRDRGFLLTISAPRQVWASGQPIAVSSEFSYLGPGATEVWGPGPGPHVGFDVVELTGHRKMQAIWLLACQSWTMTRLPITTPFRKGGGYSDDDPDAAFYRQYFADPEFRLPAGRWQITATAPFSLGPDSCGGPAVDLRASITLTVQ